ncbi:MAG: DUF4831 family protein [Muribaculaceae bacterium]|nr:DUF4831 family protein [Muribaculaceae bacterium]
MKRLLMVLSAAVMIAAASAQTTQKLSANKTNEYGLIYTLPLTAIDVTVEVEKTVKTPGDYFRYAKKYLSIDPITAKSEEWKLKSVVINAGAVADTRQRYLVQFKSGSTPFMIVDENNFPISINTDEVRTLPMKELPEAVAPLPTILQTPAAAKAMTEEMLQSPSSAKRAELAAARIFELRQNRTDVVSGQADQMPSDGTAMQLALSTLDEQEEALTAMFAGTVQTSTEVMTFRFVPDSVDTQRTVIARLSPVKGLVDASDLSGAPIYLDVKVTERGVLPINEKGEVKRFPKGGFAYRIPGTAQVTVTYDGNTAAKAAIPVAQAGMVFGLDPNLFTDKKAPATAILNPLTGAIVEIGTAPVPAK